MKLVLIIMFLPFSLYGNVITEGQFETKRGVTFKLEDEKPFTGKVALYFPDGSLKSVTEYVDGTKNGFHKEFYSNGVKKLVVEYQRNPEHCTISGWYPNGMRFFEAKGKDPWNLKDQTFWSKDGKEIESNHWFRGTWPYLRSAIRLEVPPYIRMKYGQYSSADGGTKDTAIQIIAFNSPSGRRVEEYLIDKKFNKSTITKRGEILKYDKVIKWYALVTKEGDLKTIYFDATNYYGII